MSDDFGSTTFPDDSASVTPSPPEPMARHWGVVLAVGAATFLLGVALSVWPRETVAVVSFLLAIHLVMAGGSQLVLALVSSSRPGPARLVAALAGAVAVVVGVLLLLHPLQTLTFVGWAAGLCVTTVGAADLVDALWSPASRHRGWLVVRGIVEVAVGLFLLVNPDLSLGLLVVIACVWLIAYGFITVIAALLVRSERSTQPPEAGDRTRPGQAEC